MTVTHLTEEETAAFEAAVELVYDIWIDKIGRRFAGEIRLSEVSDGWMAHSAGYAPS